MNDPGAIPQAGAEGSAARPTVPDPTRTGPLDHDTAAAMLHRADELLAAGDFADAGRHYQRVIGASDVEQTAAALFGLGMCFYRLDQEDRARATWEQVLALPEAAVTYRAWREIAAMRVRDKDLAGAQRAYREAERRAPPQDRAEISSRLGWLAKEMGDPRGANRYFARSRGGTAAPLLTFALIAITSVISIVAFDQSDMTNLLILDKAAVANGEYWRLWTVTLLHAGYLHLFFNMYALYLAGSLVEQIYGWKVYLLIYMLCAPAASVASFVFLAEPAVGASGAIFGLFGVLLAVSRTHHPVLDRRGQMLLGQIGGLIVLNLILGFGLAGIGGGIDNSAHVGGLIAGLWLGFLLVPGRVPTLGGLWQRPVGQAPSQGGIPAPLQIVGVLALVLVIALGILIGTPLRLHDQRFGGDLGSPSAEQERAQPRPAV
jgi:membrane associated rhomboid family serine protease